jgi:RimJ/RimL family protein N-acetyltransferase
MADADFLLRLRNDPATRANSHTMTPVTPCEHQRWLQWNLKDPFVRIYIGLVRDMAIGVVRVAEESTGKLFSWTIAPEFRGMGYGRALVSSVVQITPGWLKAEIKAGNSASRHIAQSVGFHLDHEHNGICYYNICGESEWDHLAVLRHI